jgi:cellulase/cellobiase CelA1
VNLFDRAIIQGSVVTQGTIFVGSNVTITGSQSPGTAVILPNLPALPTFPGTFAAGIQINSGSQNIAPGAYKFLNVASGATAILTASGTTTGGQYFFQNISINGFLRAAAVVMTNGQATGGTRIFVQNSFTLLNSIRPLGTGTTVQTSFLGLATTDSTTLQVPFNGTVLAPNAALTMGTGPGLSFTGAFYARALTASNDSQLLCSRPSALVTTAPSGVSATLQITNDWGAGYCGQLFVTNTGSATANNWWVSLDTNQSTIYDDWNGIFSASSGAITIYPEYGWNQTILGGATDSSIGFCTNRNTPASTFATVLGAFASY